MPPNGGIAASYFEQRTVKHSFTANRAAKPQARKMLAYPVFDFWQIGVIIRLTSFYPEQLSVMELVDTPFYSAGLDQS
ncbi:MAG: hypothetical protein ACKVRN_03585 [Pyrinomonadaceae bacterium]